MNPAAQNFTMPALSPTMTEGTIANWKVKEGQPFSAGDVLLEIETDKATMDVEAQEDGVLMRIMRGEGSQGVQVGSRIAVIAEPGDDLSTLEIPPDEAPKKPAEPAKADEPKSAPPPAQETKKTRTGGGEREVKYPLLPSVQALVAQHGLDESAIRQVTPTGPGGRILKGDVLAYLGAINASTPSNLSSHIDRLSHLDLSNIKVAAPKEPPKEPSKEPEPKSEAPAPPAKSEVSVRVSMSRVIETQQKIHSSIGTFLPISSFVSRAADVANNELPRATRAPTPDELFNAVLGIDTPDVGTRGSYAPRISALKGVPPPPPKKADIIDVLTGADKKRTQTQPTMSAVPGLSTGTNIFSLEVPKEEEKRAAEFLDRVKLILENEPGRLVL